jgi:SAM-dependent methyltransferase
VDESDDLLKQQLDYYRARANEYDEWFLRVGRYDRGEEHRKVWSEEVAQVRSALANAQPNGNILELACGTGLWTQHLLAFSEKLTAVDASPEMLDLCRKRIGANAARFIQADLFEWVPNETYDFVFFGFWLSHIPEERFAAFWKLLEKSLKPAGRVFFVDNLFTEYSNATDHERIDRRGTVERKLNDGRRFKIVKFFYEPDILQKQLLQLGWEGAVQSTGQFFLHGHVGRAETKPDH